MGAMAGYIMGRIASTSTTVERKPDKILAWDSDVLAYRPVPANARVQKGVSYLLCYEAKVYDKKKYSS